MVRIKSLEKQPDIIPGCYNGLWSAYFVQVIFHNGNISDKIEVTGGGV
jgi:hypothetical protein